jgi:hypothetical protein
MCFGDPAKSLSIARSRMPAEQWARFEREFADFCVVQGLPDKWAYWPTYDWSKWAFFQGRQHQSPEPIYQARLEGQFRWMDFAKEDWDLRQGSMYEKRIVHIVKQSQDQRVADAHYERMAIAMMDDEQAVASLERWKEGK